MPSDEYISTPCDVNASCTNGRGDLNCECNAGFIGDGSTFENINECDSVNSYHSDAICSDYNGLYSCQCKNGLMIAVLLVMILTSSIKMLTTLIISVPLPVLADRAFMPMVTTVLISTSAL